jgi:spermidine/putrescine transport system permease protein
MSVRWVGFSLRWYKQLFVTPEIVNALGVSLIVAACSTFLSVALGTALVFASKWWRPRFLFEIFYPNIILPEIILALGLLSTFVFLKIPLGYGSLIAGHTLLGLGFVIPIVRARFVELDPVLTEASADLGAMPLQTFRKIVMPLLMPSIIAASLLVFTLSLDDFFIAFFCSGAQIETLSIYVFSKVREGIDPSVNAIAALLLAISSISILILSYLKVLDQVISNE